MQRCGVWNDCGPTLGSTLISLFGALPEAFKAKPKRFTQCPDAGTSPGTCTMHTSRLDLGPALVALGYLKPPVANTFVPSPNHSHVLINQDLNFPAVWWQVIPVLVLQESDWPNKQGTTGLTSFSAIQSTSPQRDVRCKLRRTSSCSLLRTPRAACQLTTCNSHPKHRCLTRPGANAGPFAVRRMNLQIRT